MQERRIEIEPRQGTLDSEPKFDNKLNVRGSVPSIAYGEVLE